MKNFNEKDMRERILFLFSQYPKLKKKVSWIPLLNSNTIPIDRLSNLESKVHLSTGAVYIKRDDKNHDTYGGNKIRKFEFLFGRITEKKRDTIMLIGGIGSNQVLAAQIISRKIYPPLKNYLFLSGQPLTKHVQNSLLLFNYFNPKKMCFSSTYYGLLLKILWFKMIHPKIYIIFPGGSLFFSLGTPIGTIGFIEAAFELHEQIKKGVIPEPDIIFIPCASCGSAAGLIVGCKLLKLKTKIHAVSVGDKAFNNKKAMLQNCNKVIKYLNEKDKSFPKLTIREDDFKIIYGYLGTGYGSETPDGKASINLLMNLEGYEKGFVLETTYTGKTVAAMLDFLKKEENKDKKVLFWNTFNSNDLSHYLHEIHLTWENLPKKFHKFYIDNKTENK